MAKEEPQQQAPKPKVKSRGLLASDLDIKTMRRKFRQVKPVWKLLWTLITIGFLLIMFGSIFDVGRLIFYVVITFFIITIPLSLFLYSEHQKVASVEEHFPDFLRDIAEYKRSGITLARAIQNTSGNDYGLLSPEVKKIAKELSWGVSFNDAMTKLTERVESPMVSRSVSIITIAQAAGGEVTTILETVAGDLRKLKELEKERKSKLSVYTMTIYVIYLLLLFIIIILTDSLVPAVPKMQAAGEFLGGSTSGSITEFEFRTLLYHVSIIEAFFAGLISGLMGEGNIAAGLKHSIILVGITLFAFQLVPAETGPIKIAQTVFDLPPTKGLTSRGLGGIMELTEGFTTGDVAREVSARGKEFNRQQYKGFRTEDIIFQSFACQVCDLGSVITVSRNEVNVYEQLTIRFEVKYAQDHYEVSFSDI